jgi:cardiolipin synthase (CMP-forming)
MKDIYTIPNFISFYRLLAFPVILYFIFTGQENLFAVFLVINLLSDVADGFIARRFNMETEFGSRLDSIADNTTYLLAFTGILIFKLEDLMPHIFSFTVFFLSIALTHVVSLIKFGRFPSLHLYSTKVGGYIQGLFFILLFTIGFITPLYYLMVVWAIASSFEHVTIQLTIPEMKTNARGLYWMIREKEIRL